MMLDRFFIRDQMMFCGVKVGETKGYAQIDTGAGYPVINMRSFNALKECMKLTGNEDVLDPMGKKTVVKVYSCDSVYIDKKHLGRSKFLLMDISALEEILENKIDVVFGLEAIIKHSWLIDISNGFLCVS
jgi:hypothetical protein